MKNSQNTPILYNYKVTNDPDILDTFWGITPAIKEKIILYTNKLKNKNWRKMSDELNELISKYPFIPQFKNLLSAVYANKNDFKTAREINHQILREHPDYFFARLNLANEYIAEGQYSKVPEVLGNLLEIQDLYPSRRTFHFHEVIPFYETASRYFIGIENFEAAKSRIDAIEELVIASGQIPILQSQLNEARRFYLAKKNEAEEKTNQNSKVNVTTDISRSNGLPTFTHPEIAELYKHDLHIPEEKIMEILSLPRQSLIADLEMVLVDSIIRFNYFSNELEWNPMTHEFHYHALFLLVELNSVQSLPVILDILRQDEEFLDFWYSDYLTEDFWQILFVLGKNQLDLFSDFVKDPFTYTYSKTTITTAVSQWVLHFPEMRDAIINWYRDIFNFFILEKENSRWPDSDLVGLMVCNVLDFKGIELEPEIIKIYNLGLAPIGMAGPLKEVVEDLRIGLPYDPKREIKKNIFERYGEALNTWIYYNEDEEEENHEIPDNYFPSFSNPIQNPLKQINRNDPCPCGSGLKFKKCHGK